MIEQGKKLEVIALARRSWIVVLHCISDKGSVTGAVAWLCLYIAFGRAWPPAFTPMKGVHY